MPILNRCVGAKLLAIDGEPKRVMGLLGFPWNLSGAYPQCLSSIYCVDSDGIARNLLGDYYRTTRELASNIFRKGYQWPFHASRMLDFSSSPVDLAIFRETWDGTQGPDGFQPESGAGCGRHAVLAQSPRSGCLDRRGLRVSS